MLRLYTTWSGYNTFVLERIVEVRKLFHKALRELEMVTASNLALNARASVLLFCVDGSLGFAESQFKAWPAVAGCEKLVRDLLMSSLQLDGMKDKVKEMARSAKFGELAEIEARATVEVRHLLCIVLKIVAVARAS